MLPQRAPCCAAARPPGDPWPVGPRAIRNGRGPSRTGWRRHGRPGPCDQPLRWSSRQEPLPPRGSQTRPGDAIPGNRCGTGWPCPVACHCRQPADRPGPPQRSRLGKPSAPGVFRHPPGFARWPAAGSGQAGAAETRSDPTMHHARHCAAAGSRHPAIRAGHGCRRSCSLLRPPARLVPCAWVR